MFEPPPMEWIAERLGRLQDLLERQTERSALLLRRVLGPVRLVPTRPDVGPALLSRRNRPPGPRAARAPGGRFELVATVEAGGIEPPSEGASASASTCVACVLISPCSLPQAGSRAASQRLVSAPVPPAVAGTQPEVMTLEPALRAQAGRAWRPN